VATNGNDGRSGTRAAPDARRKDGPLATLARARDLARGSKATGATRRIVVRGGRYFLGTPLELGAADSGLSIEATAGETPVLYGGKRITGWQRDGEHYWSARLPEVAAGKWDFRLLVVDGVARRRARLPETDFFIHLTEFKVPWMSTTGGGWQRKPTPQELTTLRYRPGDLGPWLDVRNAELTVYPMWDESCVGLATHDPATQTLTFSTPAGHPPGAFGVQTYVVWNVRQGMHAPGLWYLDRSAGKVVYWPLPGQDMSRAAVYAPTATSILRVAGRAGTPVENVTLRGLTLTVTNTPLKAGGFGAGDFDGAVSLAFTRGCRLERLAIRNVAGWGIKAHASDGLRIAGCEVGSTGAGGIRLDGADAVVEDNHVHHAGFLYPSAIGVWIGGARAAVRHNEIHDTPYTAVIAGGTDHRIEHNLIHHAMQELHDGAGIYVTFCKGIQIRGNVVRDIEDTGGYGASAYYLDEQAENCVVEGNLSLRVARPSHNHMARNNILRGNVFIIPGDAKLTFPRCSGYTLEGNVIAAGGAITFQSPPGDIAAMPRNVLSSAAGKVELETLADYAVRERAPLVPRDGTRFADPLFVNPAKGDYRFRPGSPAAQLGIRPLDPAQAGRK
jgi:hypothetical protein